MTHYKVLGIDMEASANDIQLAYFRRALALQKAKLAPDIYISQFLQVRRSYEILSDPSKRARYDSEFERGLPGTSSEESSNWFNVLIRCYFFRWKDFSSFPLELRRKKILIEIILWIFMFVVGACIAVIFGYGGSFDYTSVEEIVITIIMGCIFALGKEIYYYIHDFMVGVKNKE